MDFFTAEVTLTTTATEEVGSVNFDRVVLVRAVLGGSDIKVGFTNDPTFSITPSNGVVSVPLPAGQSLWAESDTGSAYMRLLVTRT